MESLLGLVFRLSVIVIASFVFGFLFWILLEINYRCCKKALGGVAKDWIGGALVSKMNQEKDFFAVMRRSCYCSAIVVFICLVILALQFLIPMFFLVFIQFFSQFFK